MARARVRLNHLSKGIKGVLREVGKLRGKGADPAAERELRALHKKLTSVQKMMAAACPDTQFRSFEVAEPLRARKTARKRTRKVR